MEENGNISKNV